MNKNKGLNLFNHTFLCKSYADQTTFFLSDKESVIKVKKMYFIPGFIPNKSKSQILVGIGDLTGVFRGAEYIELTAKAITILRAIFL